jgi:O-antigen ligase
MSDRSPLFAAGQGFRRANARPGRLVAWVALLALLAVAGAWLSLGLRRAGSAYPGVSPAVPLAAAKSYGVSADLAGYTEAELGDALDRMEGLGLRWIRQPFPWSEIEPEPGRFNWAPWDRVVEAASAREFQVIAVLDTAPAWARPAGTDPPTPPTELADFGNFARALAERYGDRLDFYQVWDEPNLSANWGGRFVDPAAYAGLLQEAAANLRAADRQAVILAAALAPTLEDGPLNLDESTFLAGLYAANAAEWFDVVAVQPYGFDRPPAEAARPAALNFARVELIRQTMAAHGDEHTAVWATAFGWSALPEPWSGQPSPWPSLPADRQAAYTAAAIRRARADWPWLGPMLFAAWDARALPADDPRRGLALVSGLTPLPQAGAYSELRSSYVNNILPGEELATVGFYPAAHASGHYTGDWRFAPAGADVPRHPPARLTIPFEGTRLDLKVRRGNFRGFLYVSIDGRPAGRLPQQAGRAYLVLYDPLEREDIVTLARYLPDGLHIAEIEAEGGWYQWPLVGWRVSREADTRPLALGLALVAGLACLALAGVAGSIRRLPGDQARQLLDAGEALAARYLAMGTAAHLLLLAAAAAAFYLAPGSLPSLALLGLLFLAILPRPDLGLALVAFSLPFFLIPKPLLGRTIALPEVGVVLVALAHVARRSLGLLYQGPGTRDRLLNSAPAGSARPARAGSGSLGPAQAGTGDSATRPTRLDLAAWLLTGIALVAGALSVTPAANVGSLAAADWPVWTLLLLPPAGVLAAAAGGSGSVRELRRGPARGLDLAVAVLIALALAATLAAGNLGVSLQEFHVVIWDGAAFYAFVRLIEAPPQVRAGRGVSGVDLPGIGAIWRLIDAFLLGAVLMAVYAVYQFFFTDQAITAEGVHRALGAYGSPNNLALLLDRALPILATVAAFSGPAGRMARRRVLYALGLIPVLAALPLTFSRGALLLGVPAALLFIGVVRGGRVLWGVLAALAAGGAGLLPFLGTDRFRSMLDLESGTGFFRLRLWQSTLAMLRDHPWLGVGLDNFLYEYRTRYILPDAWQEPDLSHPHNIVLDFGTRLGLGGIAVLAWLQVAFWRTAWPLYRRQPEGPTRALILGLMAGMVAILAHGLVDNSFFLVDLAFIFFLIIGSLGWMAGRLVDL